MESYLKGLISTDELHSYIFEPASEQMANKAGVSDVVRKLIIDNFYYEDFEDDQEYQFKMAREALDKANRLLQLIAENRDEELDQQNWFIKK